ncbi:MAG: hypothetical protein HY719_03200 [Planctomycetes bacterium]|nr:hypothetical protein [Planctomycetota bacterium]
MAGTYSDNEIAALVQERKPLPAGWRNRMRLRPKRGHDERDLDMTGDAGNKFRLILRQNKVNALDFSAILAVHVPQSNQLFRLRRYNGKSHEHTNHIEDSTFYDFHVHVATERYQQLGTREDAYAEPTDRYGDLHGALRCLIDDANLDVPPESQTPLFEEV